VPSSYARKQEFYLGPSLSIYAPLWYLLVRMLIPQETATMGTANRVVLLHTPRTDAPSMVLYNVITGVPCQM
jgi:hypothetical protein